MLDYDVCADGSARCAHGHSLPRHVAGCSCSDGDGGVCGDSGHCNYVAGHHIESPPCQPALLRPPLHPSSHAGACGGASDQGPDRFALPDHWMYDCAAYGCDAPTGGDCDGGDGDGGCAEVSLVQFSRAALLLLFGPLRPAGPVLGLKGPPGLGGSPGNLSSWGLQISWFSAHPSTRK